MTDPRKHPRLWVVCRELGRSSETWILRQLRGFSRLSPRVVCWKEPPAACVAPGIYEVSVLDTPDQPYNDRRRWLHRLRAVPGGNYYASMGRERRLLLDLAERTRPDVILCHFGTSALRLAPIAEAVGVPLVAHFHGSDLSSTLRNRWYCASLSRVAPRFDAAVIVGSHQRARIQRFGVDPEKVHLIPCGAPVSEYEPRPLMADAPDGTTPGRPVRYCSVGRLIPMKGHDVLIRAFALATRGPGGVNATLTIAGDGPDRAALESLARELGVAHEVTLSGALSHDGVRQILRESDVYCQFSVVTDTGHDEGFGVAATEAAATGLPVIASDSGGLPDQVVHNRTGVLIPERNVEAGAEAIRRLAGDPPLREEMGRAGRERALREFDTARQVAKLEVVLLNLMRRGGAWIVRSPTAGQAGSTPHG